MAVIAESPWAIWRQLGDNLVTDRTGRLTCLTAVAILVPGIHVRASTRVGHLSLACHLSPVSPSPPQEPLPLPLPSNQYCKCDVSPTMHALAPDEDIAQPTPSRFKRQRGDVGVASSSLLTGRQCCRRRKCSPRNRRATV